MEIAWVVEGEGDRVREVEEADLDEVDAEDGLAIRPLLVADEPTCGVEDPVGPSAAGKFGDVGDACLATDYRVSRVGTRDSDHPGAVGHDVLEPGARPGDEDVEGHDKRPAGGHGSAGP